MNQKDRKSHNQRSYSVKKNIYTHSLYKKQPLLNHLDIELTERCNNNCIHCYINQPEASIEAKRKELSTVKIKKILEEAGSLGCMDVRFTGGEPLLRDDFEELYTYARKLGFRVSIFTNATLISQNLCSLLKKTPPLEFLEVTIYGMNQNTYEQITRTQGSYEKFKKGIDQLLKHNIPFRIKMPYFSYTEQDVSQVRKFASQLPWKEKKPGYTVSFDLRARRDSPKKNRLIKELRNDPQESLKFLSRKKERWLKDRVEFSCKFLKIPGDRLFSCGAGQGTGCVDAYGNFQLCMLLRHPQTTYDLNQGTLKEALSHFFTKVRSLRANNPDYLRRCAQCFLSALCEQCPGRSWMEHGTLDTPVEYYCQMAHLEALKMGLLNKGEKAWEIKDWKKRLHHIKFKPSQGENHVS